MLMIKTLWNNIFRFNSSSKGFWIGSAEWDKWKLFLLNSNKASDFVCVYFMDHWTIGISWGTPLPPLPNANQIVLNFMFFWDKICKNMHSSRCVLPACCPYLPACTAQGGVCFRGVCYSKGGCLLPGGCLPRGVCHSPLWTEWQTGVKTLPCRIFVADGKHKLTFRMDLRPHSP